MAIIGIVIGVVLALAIVGGIIFSILKTPDNLRGFYGSKYAILSAIGLLACAALIVISILFLK